MLCMSRNCQFRHLKPAILLLFLAGCSTAELTVDLIKKSKKRVQQVEIEKAIEDGTITANPIYKIGNPYQVGGVCIILSAIWPMMKPGLAHGMATNLLAG